MQSRPGLDCPPLPPGARQIPSGRGFLFLLQILRRVRHLSRRKREVGASPGGARRAGSEGECGRGKAHKPSKSGSQAAITAGLDKTAMGGGGRSRSEGGPVTIYFERPPPPGGRSRCTKRGPVAIRITTDPLPGGGRSKYIATGPPGYRDRPPPPV